MAVIDFWDTVYSKASDSKTLPYGCCSDALAFFGDVNGRSILEVGAGSGANATFWLDQGARVTAIDNSPVAIAELKKNCPEATGIVCDAFEIGDLGRFDLVFGSMILHHLEPFDQFVDQLHAALVPGGCAYFYENSAMSQALVWCRNNLVGRFGIPKYGDDEEHPLTPAEVGVLRSRFDVDQRFPTMFFFELIAGYLLRGRFRKPLKALDRLAGKTPLRRYSYRQTLRLTKRGQAPFSEHSDKMRAESHRGHKHDDRAGR